MVQEKSDDSSLIYGGDEVTALVLDPGSVWTRVGFAGEETPKCVLPSDFAYFPQSDGSRKFCIGDHALLFPQTNLEVDNPMKEGVIHDWEACTAIWDHAFNERLRVDTSDHPLLVTEPSWNPPKAREKTMEIAFESLGFPAFFLSKQGVCAAFANGKSTALVVDVGGKMASVIPVYDGAVVRKGILKQELGGAAINERIRQALDNTGISYIPQYQIERKQMYSSEQPFEPIRRQHPPVTQSFHEYSVQRLLHQFKENTCSFTDVPFGQSAPAARQAKPFEFPSGFHTTFGDERFAVCEPIFDPSFRFIGGDSSKGKGLVGLAHLAYQSISACDIEYRGAMLNNIVITGGTTLLPSFSRRLQNELSALLPGHRAKVQALGNTVERKCAAWLGASILASLSTIHQLWISKCEYDEVGPDRNLLIERRCK